MMKIKDILQLLLTAPLCLAPAPAANAQDSGRALHPDIATRTQYNPWEQSLNPAGIRLTEIDSLLEATIGYDRLHPALAATDQPENTISYNGTADGYKRLGNLRLAGGMGWRQDRLKGQQWNLTVQPGYLVTAGDSLSNPRHTEQYSLYGKAAYAFSPRLTAGLGGAYTATDNQDASPEERCSGRATTLTLSAGLIRTGKHGRIGLSAVYIRRNELLSYASNDKERLYTFPLGYFLPMSELNHGGGGMLRSTPGNSSVFRSTGNGWQAALQGEYRRAQVSWFNELQLGFERRGISPDDSENMYGWKEKYLTLGYRSQLDIRQGRWTHLISPAVGLRRDVNDRILQRPDPDNINATWNIFGRIRFASRHTADVSVGYELARDYTPDGATLAWQLAAGWTGRRDELYSYPYAIAQQTGVFRVEAAFLRRIALPHAGRLTLRPSVTLLTGSGTEERLTREENNAEVEMNSYRNYERVSSSFAALTATRLRAGLQAEYRRPLVQRLDGGLRLRAEVEQVTRNISDYQINKTGRGITLALIVWL